MKSPDAASQWLLVSWFLSIRLFPKTFGQGFSACDASNADLLGGYIFVVPSLALLSQSFFTPSFHPVSAARYWLSDRSVDRDVKTEASSRAPTKSRSCSNLIPMDPVPAPPPLDPHPLRIFMDQPPASFSPLPPAQGWPGRWCTPHTPHRTSASSRSSPS